VDATLADTTGVAIGDLIANGLDFNDPISCISATKSGNTADLCRPVLAITQELRCRFNSGSPAGVAVSQSN
jgi:hypothetical protein